jgi:DNA invertase Pin-like site-specific DNA recombinase
MTGQEPSEGLPAVFYAAKSTEDKRGSIATQLEDCRAGAEAEGRQVIGEFSDEAASAFKGNRGSGLIAAKDAAIQSGAELWVQHSDRLARGDGITADHLAEVWFALRRHGVRLRSVQDDSNLEDAIRVVLIGERNFEDSRRKSAAVKSGMERRKQRGLATGSPPKLGYVAVRDEYGRTVPELPYVPVPAEAAIVNRMYAEYAAGKSQKQITRRLNADGLTAKRGGTWTQGTVSKILSDPRYMGYLPDADGKLIEAQHEAIVSPALWRQVETLRKAGRKSEGGKRGRMTRGRHLLVNGHLRCGQCGAAMIPRTSVRTHGAKQYPYEVYRCSSRLADVNSCAQAPVKREIIDTGLLDYLTTVALDVEQTKRQYLEAADARSREAAELSEHAEHEAMRIQAGRQRAEDDYLAGKLDAERWQRLDDRLRGEYEAAEALLSRLSDQEAQIAGSGLENVGEAVLRRFADLRRAVSGEIASAQDVAALRAVLTRLFERFELRDDRGGQLQADLLEGGDKLVWRNALKGANIRVAGQAASR